MRTCPGCHQPVVPTRSVAAAVVGMALSCGACATALVVPAGWQAAIAVVFVVTLALGAVSSVECRSLLAYVLTVAATLAAMLGAGAVANLRVKPRTTARQVLAPWIGLFVFFGTILLTLRLGWVA